MCKCRSECRCTSAEASVDVRSTSIDVRVILVKQGEGSELQMMRVTYLWMAPKAPNARKDLNVGREDPRTQNRTLLHGLTVKLNRMNKRMRC